MSNYIVRTFIKLRFNRGTDDIFGESLSLADEVLSDANMDRALSARPKTVVEDLVDKVEQHMMKVRLEHMNENMREKALWTGKRYIACKYKVFMEGSYHKVEEEMEGRD